MPIICDEVSYNNKQNKKSEGYKTIGILGIAGETTRPIFYSANKAKALLLLPRGYLHFKSSSSRAIIKKLGWLHFALKPLSLGCGPIAKARGSHFCFVSKRHGEREREFPVGYCASNGETERQAWRNKAKWYGT